MDKSICIHFNNKCVLGVNRKGRFSADDIDYRNRNVKSFAEKRI